MRTKLVLHMISTQLVYMYIDPLKFFFVFFALTSALVPPLELIRMEHWHRQKKRKEKKNILFTFHFSNIILLYIENPLNVFKTFELDWFP